MTVEIPKEELSKILTALQIGFDAQKSYVDLVSVPGEDKVTQDAQDDLQKIKSALECINPLTIEVGL